MFGVFHRNGNQTENMGQEQGMRPGMGSGLRWEQDGTREEGAGHGSDSKERGIQDRGHQEPVQGNVGVGPGQWVLEQLPQTLHHSLPVQSETLGPGFPKP